MTRILGIIVLCVSSLQAIGQTSYIYSKEGRRIMDRETLISQCLRSLRKDRNDQTALNICNCKMDKLNGYFSNKQYREYTVGPIVDVQKLIEQDSAIKIQIQDCVTNSGKSLLLSVQGFRNESISRCIETIHKNSSDKLDSAKVQRFCICQMDLVKTKKLSDKEYESIYNPNSVLFYEVIYKCGNPFADSSDIDNSWNPTVVKDITGPISDTVKILTLNGMSYLKMKTGSLILFWLFDTGASDFLITSEMETTLRKENIIVDSNYLGIGKYEMANGMVDTCRKYNIDGVRIGKYYIDNITVAVSNKAKRIIAGKNLMNKFSSWMLDNTNNTLILNK